jgi:hypothetical protein
MHFFGANWNRKSWFDADEGVVVWCVGGRLFVDAGDFC